MESNPGRAAEYAQAAAPSVASGETFCIYLAKQLIAKQGFVTGAPAQVAEIAAQSDYLLSFNDGYSSVIVAMIDREAHPDKAFTLSVLRVRAIAESCRALVGRVGATKMPVTIQLMEVGGATPDQPARLSEIKPTHLFSKEIVSAWAIDPQHAAIWTTAGYRGRGMRKFVQNLLDSPREAVVMPEPVAVAPRSFPWLTAAIIVLLAAIFAAELMLGVGGIDASKQPTVATLLAFGGEMGSLVRAGEWYRLFTAPLLHGGFQHILLNAVSLGLAGHVLEPLIGRPWFAALFIIGAIGGSLASLMANADNIVSVGASGAVMALFACMLVLSTHFAKGGIRTRLQMNAVYVLIPSLLPLTSAAKGAKIDYAAHFGGAVVGALIGAFLLTQWRRDEMHPRLASVAAAIAIAGLATFGVSGVMAQRSYAVYELSAALAPAGVIPTTEDGARRQSADLVTRYPRDPRIQLLHAVTLIRARDNAGAERALRTALAKENLWRRAITGGDLSERIHIVLAALLLESGKRDEAREIARPACKPETPQQLRAVLDQQKLCE
jgi:rhomboid protease GluP